MQKLAFFIYLYWSNFDFSAILVLLGPYARFFTWKVHLLLFECYSISIRIISEKTKWPSLWEKWALDRKNTIHRSITHFLPQKPLQKYMGSRGGMILISFDEARFTQTRDKAYIVKIQRCMTTPDKCGFQIKSAITVGKISWWRLPDGDGGGRGRNCGSSGDGSINGNNYSSVCNRGLLWRYRLWWHLQWQL